jgi:hypothetical protein
VVEGGRWHDRRHGYSVASPGETWKAVDLPGAALAFRGPGDRRMSLAVRCGRPPRAAPQLLARQLLIGLEERHVLEEGPVTLAGGPAWRQTVEARDGGTAVRLDTLTGVLGGCVHDWVLVSPEGTPAAAPEFEAFWSSFRRETPADELVP